MKRTMFLPLRREKHVFKVQGCVVLRALRRLLGNFVGEVASGNRKIFKTVIQGRVFQKEEHKNHVKLGKPTSVCKRHQIV